ncbi:MAG: anaerobic ribonucleoside-triphosphate reductase activating protein [Lachnospiraceae bacterium]|nr:anaerobic ribonucleoside-triphosphate reductase activating protein [Lachnospiraceae bacterium]
MNICGYQKTTLLDYPGHVAATFFTGGCNFRCPFCHNSDLITYPSSTDNISEEEIFTFLKKRKNILSGICITGGEPTLQPDLAEFIEKVRSYGYKIKLDTNGYRPEVIADLLEKNLLDYIAMDIKAGYSNYVTASGISNLIIKKIEDSVSIIENSGIPYEFRTTVVKELHNETDFQEIADMISPKSPYFIQSFKDSGNILISGLSSCNNEELNKFLSIVKEKLPNSSLRGID